MRVTPVTAPRDAEHRQEGTRTPKLSSLAGAHSPDLITSEVTESVTEFCHFGAPSRPGRRSLPAGFQHASPFPSLLASGPAVPAVANPMCVYGIARERRRCRRLATHRGADTWTRPTGPGSPIPTGKSNGRVTCRGKYIREECRQRVAFRLRR